MTRATLHHYKADVSPIVLAWAIERANGNNRDLARSIGTTEVVVAKWLDGSQQPSFRQARQIADSLRLPFGFLFLSAPPPEDLPIPDFRRAHGHAVGEISPDLRDVILATLRRQDWLAERREEMGAEPVAVVGSLQGSTQLLQIAQSIRVSLDLSRVTDRPRNTDAFLRSLVERAEDVGVSVLRSGIVGLNTHRKLDVREFRGFSISHPLAPFIFINGADAKTGQVFTLIHELVHIWLGQSGISGSVRDAQSPAEALCNKVAAEVLVPVREFVTSWNADGPLEDSIKDAAFHFRVSRYVIAIRAFESGLISRPILDRLLADYDANARSRAPKPGGDFYRTTIARNGRSFTSDVVAALDRQQVLVRDAAYLLEIQPRHLDRLGRELRGRA